MTTFAFSIPAFRLRVPWGLFVLLGLLCASSASLAATVSVGLAVPKIEVGQSTRLMVTVVGEQPRAVPVVDAPDGVVVRFSERRHEFESTPAGVFYVYRYGYRVTALEEGTFELGPVTVSLGPDPRTGNAVTATSDVVTLRAVASGTMTKPNQALEATSVFLREEVWEGEVVLYQAKLVTQQPILDVDWGFPDFAGLQVPPRGRAEQTQNTIEDPTGDIKVITATVPLVAAGTGDRSQGPAIAKVRVLSGVNQLGIQRARQRTVAASRAPLKVRPLPQAPAEFSGLVGDFRLQAELAKTDHIAVGESVPLTVRISGNGVADGVALPEVTGDGVRVYNSDSRTVGRMVNGRFYGEKEFKLTLVPGRVGTLPLSDISLMIFSPTEGAFKTITTSLGAIEVVGEDEGVEITSFSPDGEALPDGGEAVEAVDLRGVYTWGPAWTPPLAPLIPFLLGIVLLPGLMALGAEGAGGLRGWWNARGQAKAEAFRGKKRLASPPQDPEDFLAVCDLALRETLADKVGVSVGALRRDAALETLPDAVAQEVRRALAGLDRARFAGGAVPADVLERILSAIRAVEAA